MVLPVALCAFVICGFACVSVSTAQFDSEAQFRSPQIPEANSILESTGEQLGERQGEQLGEQFRADQYQPTVPFPEEPNNKTVPRNNSNVPLTGPSPNQQDSFVPRESTPSGFVPVRPQTELTLDAEDLVGEFQLDVPSRNKEEEKILSLLRSDEIDKAFEATQNRDGSELIKQFYPDGKVQIERYVAQNENGDYYNHGSWKLLNRRGQVMAKGQFEEGLMSGTWERWHPANSSGMFQSAPFNEFKGPFVSTATFKEGKLDGVWAIFDQFQRKIVEIPYREGLRHGTATWKFADSSNMRIAKFSKGQMDGPLYEWDRDSKLVRNDEYINGRRVIRNVTFYRPKQRRTENYYLEGEYQLEGTDSWWDAKPAEYVQTGSRVQHGPSQVWYENGQIKMRGSYQSNEPVGGFTWWHGNGQRELTGMYAKGVKVGKWTGWHENGIKSFEGNFEDDKRIGKWQWWGEDGKVRARKDFDQEESESTEELKKPKPDQPSDTDDGSATESYNGAEEITPAEEMTSKEGDASGSEPNFSPGEYPEDEAVDDKAADTEKQPEASPIFREPKSKYGKDPFDEQQPNSGSDTTENSGSGSGSGS